MLNNINQTSSINNFMTTKIKHDKMIKQINDDTDSLYDEIEIEKLENELYNKSHSINYPKNYGNLWNDDERTLILNYMKKNTNFNNTSLYDDKIILKIAKKIERSEIGVKEEIKKMIFNDYIGEHCSLSKLSIKYNIPESNILILIKKYLEKNGKKCLYPIEMENKILKCKIENIKLKKELKELLNNKN